MANPQKENGYTALANELVEQLTKLDISGGETRVLWAILRKTYGFQKKHDAISLSQFKDLTGLSVRTIIRATQDLEAKKMIYIDRVMDDGAKMTNVYHFIKDYDKWVVTNVSLQTDKNRVGAKKRQAKKRAGEKFVTTNKGSDKHPLPSDKQPQKVVTNNAKKVNSLSHTKEKEITKEIDTAKVPVGTLQGVEWNEVIDSFKPVNEFFERFYKNKTQRQAITDIVKKVGKEKLLWVIKHLVHTNKKSYFPVIHTPVQLRDKWTALSDALVRYKGELATKKQAEQKVDKFTK